MRKEPIKIYKSQQQLDASLAEWQERLFLRDWIITAKVIPQAEMDLRDCAAENLQQPLMKCATIHIAAWDEKEAAESPIKMHQECSLVHELLHCHTEKVVCSEPAYEQAYFESDKHTLLELFARSLIMAKYNLPFSWFKNA